MNLKVLSPSDVHVTSGGIVDLFSVFFSQLMY